jgi:hypothetical protein
MHPVGQTWATDHANDGIGHGACATCHGADYRGTVLGQVFGDRTLSAHGTKSFWQGFQIGCYNCHPGPNGEDGSGIRPAVASNVTTNVVAETAVSVSLPAADPSDYALTFRVVTVPTHGHVSINGRVATFFPAPGFVGQDGFTFAAWNGYTDSNLGNVSVAVQPGGCGLTATAQVPTAAYPGSVVPFRAAAVLSGCLGNFSYDWDFGDGTAHGSGTNVCHPYPRAGDYDWTLTVNADGLTQKVNGIVTISPTLGPPVPLAVVPTGYLMTLTWPVDRVPVALETAYDLSQPYAWQAVFDPPASDGTNATLQTYLLPGPQFFRLRRVP